MSLLSKVLIWICLLSLLFGVGMCNRYQDHRMDEINSRNAELATDLNRIQRNLDWNRDSIGLEFEKN